MNEQELAEAFMTRKQVYYLREGKRIPVVILSCDVDMSRVELRPIVSSTEQAIDLGVAFSIKSGFYGKRETQRTYEVEPFTVDFDPERFTLEVPTP